MVPNNIERALTIFRVSLKHIALSNMLPMTKQARFAAAARGGLSLRSATAIQVSPPKFVFGDGNLVLVAARCSIDAAAYVPFDLFRVDNGKIVEHWPVPMRVPPSSEWKNENGML